MRKFMTLVVSLLTVFSIAASAETAVPLLGWRPSKGTTTAFF